MPVSQDAHQKPSLSERGLFLSQLHFRNYGGGMIPEILQFGDTGFGDELVVGALVTLEIALYSLAIGLALGLAAAGAKLSRSPVLRGIAEAYSLLVRGIPELLIILLVYYSGGAAIEALLNLFGHDGGFDFNKRLAGSLALGLIFGAFASEVFRGAFMAVPKGQIEAAVAVGMTRRQVFLRVRFPQMLRFALPGLGNLWMVLLKDTSLVSVIALDELMRETSVAAEATQRPFVLYLAATVLYLLLTIVSDFFRARLERHANRGVAGEAVPRRLLRRGA